MREILTINRLKVVMIVVAVLIAGASLIVSHALIRDLEKEERANVEVWTEAMKAFSNADETTDLNLVLKVINGNEYIPIVVKDDFGNIVTTRNVDSLDIPSVINSGNTLHINIGTDESDKAQLHVSYDESLMLKRLASYPYVQLGVVFLFVVIAIIALLASKKAEQNKVWVGLSRETAHQLGTPISALMAWMEVMQENHPDDDLLPEMQDDVKRLQLIAERFSKIGSAPELKPVNLCEIIDNVVNYIAKRTSDRVKMHCTVPAEKIEIQACAPLFEWVVENLCKNAIDAMHGEGEIFVTVTPKGQRTLVEVRDTGKGIAKKNFKNVFRPGFTTKQRGWGLGLSLAKRIVEEYHHGRIYVKSSELNRGTTFAIEI